jgi:hypothetical protein
LLRGGVSRGSEFDTVVAVYRQFAGGVVTNDDSRLITSYAGLKAVAGTTYQIGGRLQSRKLLHRLQTFRCHPMTTLRTQRYWPA